MECVLAILGSACWPLLRVFNFQVPKGQGLREEYTRSIEPALAAETLTLERILNAECGVRNAEWSCLAYALTPAEIALMWQTAPPRVPIPPPNASGI